MIIKDKNAILQALKKSERVKSIYLKPGIKHDRRTEEIIKIADEKNIPVGELRAAIQGGRGRERECVIEAHCREFEYTEPDRLKSAMADSGRRALVIALDHVQDPMNLGAIIRTAAAAGATGVLIEKSRSCGVTSTVYETSCGGAENVHIARVANLRNYLKAMKEWNCWIAGADERAETDCFEQDMSGVNVLVLGNEESGISRLVRDECDFMIRIPSVPGFPSLNVSVAAGILVFETIRQKNFT